MIDNKEIWICARTRCNQEILLRDCLIKNNILYFIPTVPKIIKQSNGVKEGERPLIPNLIFLKTNWKNAFDFLLNHKNKISYIRQKDRRILIIPERQMDDFMRLTTEMGDKIKVNPNCYAAGDRVMIKSGPLAGMEGILTECEGKKEFTLRVGTFLSVSVRIARNNLIKLSITKEQLKRE